MSMLNSMIKNVYKSKLCGVKGKHFLEVISTINSNNASASGLSYVPDVIPSELGLKLFNCINLICIIIIQNSKSYHNNNNFISCYNSNYDTYYN